MWIIITSPTQFDIIKYFINFHYRHPTSVDVYIGLRETNHGLSIYQWLENDTPLTFSKWQGNEPHEKYVRINRPNFKWNTGDGIPSLPYLCTGKTVYVFILIVLHFFK